MTTRRLLCLVTDRRRLARAVGRPESNAAGAVIEQIEGAIRGGVDLVQIREHDLDGGALARLVRDAVRLAKGTRTRIVVNDRVDVAVATGAQGVHLREAGFSAALVRQAWPALLVGRSVHSPDSVGRAGDVDYAIAGTIFPSESKSSTECLGLEGLKRIVRAASGTPVLAIGGVTDARLPLIAQAGVQGIAAIGAFMPPLGSVDVAEAVEKRVRILRFAFDTASAVS